MSDRELAALLQACKDEPEDDAARLVLADWLEEHDQADRAEFVRLQVQLAAGEVPAGDEAEVIARLHALYLRHADEWVGGLREWQRRWRFRRGLIEVHADVETLRRAPPHAVAPQVAAWLETLVLEFGRQKAVGELAKLPALAMFSGLDVTDVKLSAAWLRALGDGPHVGGLRRLVLDVAGSPLTAGEALARSPGWRGLRILEFPEGVGEGALTALAGAAWLGGLRALATRFAGGRKAVHALAQSSTAPRLRRLNWDYLAPGEEGLRALASSPLLAEVEELQLDSASLDRVEIEALGVRREWPRLRSLTLDDGVAGDGTRALARLALPALRRLNLSRNRLSAKHLTSLLAAPWLAGLERLELTTNPVGDDGARVLAGSPVAANLRHMNLAWVSLGAAGVQALADSPHLSRLETLILDGNTLGPDGVAALADADGLPALTALSLSSAHLSGEDLARLARSRLAERLKRLDLSHNEFAGADLSALGSSRLGGLKELCLTRIRVGAEGARALAAAPFRGLLRLGLRVSALEGDAVALLLGTHGFAELAVLDLWHARVGPAGRKALLAWPRLHQLTSLTADRSAGDDEVFYRLCWPVVFDPREGR